MRFQVRLLVLSEPFSQSVDGKLCSILFRHENLSVAGNCTWDVCIIDRYEANPVNYNLVEKFVAKRSCKRGRLRRKTQMSSRVNAT